VPFLDLQQLADSNSLKGRMNAGCLDMVLPSGKLSLHSTSHEQSRNISGVYQPWNQQPRSP
jgi:hypothetical protein